MSGAEHRVADRLRRISMIADDVASRPDLGPFEVGLLQELLAEADALSGADNRPVRTHEWHNSRGRAVDILPGDPFDAVRRAAGGAGIGALIWGGS